MGKAAKPRRTLVTGVKKRGDDTYRIRVHGDAATRFPPLLIKMSLHEMQQWLHQMQSAPDVAARRGRPRLRVVG